MNIKKIIISDKLIGQHSNIYYHVIRKTFDIPVDEYDIYFIEPLKNEGIAKCDFKAMASNMFIVAPKWVVFSEPVKEDTNG